MHRIAKVTLALFVLAALTTSPGRAGVDIGLSIDKDGIKGFYLAIGEHYQVKEKEVLVVREHNVPDEDLPVVFFLARHAEVAPAAIVKLRLAGKSWMAIALHFGLTAKVFYVEFDHDPGPPYGKAWGHFKKKKRTDWKSIHLTDIDIVNFVNLRFVSKRYGHTPAEVIKMRSRGDNFVAIHKQVKAAKAHHKKKTKALANSDNSKSKAKKKKK